MKTFSKLLLIICSLDFYYAKQGFEVITVSNHFEGFQRFQKSAEAFKTKLKVLWSDGVSREAKLILDYLDFVKKRRPKRAVAVLINNQQTLINSKPGLGFESFFSLGSRIILAADYDCKPNKSLANLFPKMNSKPMYLNANLMMGYAKDLSILMQLYLMQSLDMQTFLTDLFVDEKSRGKYGIHIDYDQRLFHVVQDSQEFDLHTGGWNEARQVKRRNWFHPAFVIHGSSVEMNQVHNFISNHLGNQYGCPNCLGKAFHFHDFIEYPKVAIFVSISRKAPFLEDCLTRIAKLTFQKNRIDIFLYVEQDLEESAILAFKEKFQENYQSLTTFGPSPKMSELAALKEVAEFCKNNGTSYILKISSEVYLENPSALMVLIEYDQGITAPMLLRKDHKSSSNFWGSVASDGFYQRSHNYLDIIHRELQGFWNVPCVQKAYLMKPNLLDKMELDYSKPFDKQLCQSMRDKQLFMYLTNQHHFGSLINAETPQRTKSHNGNLWELFRNRYHWKKRYIHPDYDQNIREGVEIDQPCPDVFRMPITSEVFANEMIEMAEMVWASKTQISNGIFQGESRSVDLLMTQLGYESEWQEFLRLYVKPLVEKVYTGYVSNPPRGGRNFIVRYKPDEQPNMEPHFDQSTYTVNLALNTFGTDFEGGGCRFIRSNCSISDTKKGWMILYPGKLTHWHEELTTTKGTRYILMSYIDP